MRAAVDDSGTIIPIDAARPLRLEERTDDDLVLLARGGAAGAFDILVRRWQEPIVRFAMKYLGDAVSARDVAHNAFLELHGWLGRYQPRGQFRSFVFTLALNQCRMWVRRAKYDRQARERLSAQPPADAAAPADAAILERERQRVVERALCELSPKLREVVTLRFNGDLSYEEIGTVLKIPIGTVKSRLFAALAQMRKDLAGEAP